VHTVGTVLLRGWVARSAEDSTGTIDRCGVNCALAVSVLDVGVNHLGPANPVSLLSVAMVLKHRQRIVVVGGVHHDAEADVLGVGEAGDLLSRSLGLGEHREQDGGQDRDDRDDDEEFDKRKCSISHIFSTLKAECSGREAKLAK
jgi:hypothetical protein